MRVVITAAASPLGQQLVSQCTALGHNVVCSDRCTASELPSLAGGAGRCVPASAMPHVPCTLSELSHPGDAEAAGCSTDDLLAGAASLHVHYTTI